MSLPGWGITVVVAVAIAGMVATAPFLTTGIEYRHRDNGLAYILLVMSVGIWNGAFVAQLLSPEPFVNVFFYGLTMVGALLAGLGWFLFASTASSTRDLPSTSGIYALAALVVGVDIALAVTTPVHTVFWTIPTGVEQTTFAPIRPRVGYWLHTVWLAVLFLGGALLFLDAYRRHVSPKFTGAYTLWGAAVAVSVLASNAIAPGGFGIGSLVAIGLTTTSWIQARRGSLGTTIRRYLGIGRP